MVQRGKKCINHKTIAPKTPAILQVLVGAGRLKYGGNGPLGRNTDNRPNYWNTSQPKWGERPWEEMEMGKIPKPYEIKSHEAPRDFDQKAEEIGS